MSAALRANSGSVERHQLRRRRSEMPRRRSTRQTYWSLTSPSAWARSWPVQVACPLGGDSSSFLRMRFSLAASYCRGLPGRASSAKPASRWRAKRVRHFDTRAGRVPNCAAISRFDFPWAASRTMRALSAVRRSVLWARRQRCSVRFSAGLKRMGVALLAMPLFYHNCVYL